MKDDYGNDNRKPANYNNKEGDVNETTYLPRSPAEIQDRI